MAVLSLSNLKKTWYYLQKNGIKEAAAAAAERIGQERQGYDYAAPGAKELERQRKDAANRVRISVVVPAFHTKKEHLEALLDGMKAQTYAHWELVIADAGGAEETVCSWGQKNGVKLRRLSSEAAACPKTQKMQESMQNHPWNDGEICIVRLAENAGISENTNRGVEAAAGDYIGLLDHDDLLTPDALYEMAKAIESVQKKKEIAETEPLALYSDEDKCDGDGTRFYEPHMKTDFDGELLLSNNYICHFLVMEAGLMKRLKLRSAFDGAQDYDLVLRAFAAGADFVHVPKVLYHWRCHEDSTAANPRSKAYAYEAGRRAAEDFCREKGWKVRVLPLKHLGFYRADYEGDVFEQRSEIGVLAGPLTVRGRQFFSGIYEPDGTMRYAGLRKGFSGPMHRAALQQGAEAADLRSMRVRKELEPLYREALERLEQAAGQDAKALSDSLKQHIAEQESRAFCQKVRRLGYRILWDPQDKKEKEAGIPVHEDNRDHSQL